MFCRTYASPAEETDTGTKEIKSIEEPTWIFKAGINKGKNHDRQDLSFMLRENTVMKLRQTNPAFKNQLTVRWLSNDSKEEKTIKVGSEWGSVAATIESFFLLLQFFDARKRY